MIPKYFNLVVAVFAVVFISVGETAENNVADIGSTAENNGKGNKELWFIGKVGEISYYADSGLKNWTDARAFCVANGLHLAIITTNDQWNLLVSGFNTTAFSGHHWTFLRDAHLPRQFSWDNLGTEPSTEIGIVWGNFDGNGEYQSCVTLFASSPVNTAMYINPCSSYFKVLCET